jgi:hypothetical protein
MRDEEILGLWEAYIQVHEQETSRGPRLTDTYDKWDNEDAPKSGYKPVKRLSKMKGVIRKEEVDIILSHLLDEGYAETPEAAEKIMANMSEEWRDGIVEGYKRYPAKKVGKKLDRMYNDPDNDTRFGKTGKRYSQMMTVDSHMKGEVHPLIRAYSPKKSKAKEAENRKRGNDG